MESRSHWNEGYSTRSSEAVSWYPPHATLSLEIIRAVARDKSAQIVDVGGGASNLVDDLLAEGMSNVGVLDISGAALAVARQRLGEKQAARMQRLAGGTLCAGCPACPVRWRVRVA